MSQHRLLSVSRCGGYDIGPRSGGGDGVLTPAHHLGRTLTFESPEFDAEDRSIETRKCSDDFDALRGRPTAFRSNGPNAAEDRS